MKVSLNWLKTFVDLEGITAEELASKLTFAGVEVDSVESLSKGTNLVIGKILSCKEHPDSDHLHILQVDEGPKHGIHQIVCGAPNAREGLKVIVAREGAVLPNVTIVKSKIRGIESDGMCCSLAELGVDKKYLSQAQLEGIEELDPAAPVGDENPLGFLGLDDTILDLDLLANRPDLKAMENVAREVGTILGRPVKIEDTPILSEKPSSFKVSSDSENCPLFKARVVRNIKIKPSPKWMQNILTANGVRSIDNVVDIGNFVMLLTGQPLNMYDYDKLPKKELVVIDDYEGPFVAMDEKEYSLIKGDLLVSSDRKGMCLAGIMTSKDCEVDSNTKNVVIEAASFKGATVRHTSHRLGLASESSSRFEKGINVHQLGRVLLIAAKLLIDLADAEVVEEEVSYDTLSHERKKVVTSVSYINNRLGTSFSEEEIIETLKRDHMDIVKLDGDEFEVTVPYQRIDMGGEADVSEEVIRLLGFSNIVSRLPNVGSELKGGYSPAQKRRNSIRHYLRKAGLTECLTYSLVDAKKKDAFDYLCNKNNYKVMNPMTEDRMYMRKNILPSLLEVASYNAAHQCQDLAIFEISDVDAENYASKHLGIVLSGVEHRQGLLKEEPYDFYSIKGIFEGIMALLGINENRYRLSTFSSDKNELHPGRSVEIYLGKDKIGVMGEIHPLIAKDLDLAKNTIVLELDLNALLEVKTSPVKASVPARFPSVNRDLAFLVKEDVTYENIKREIKRADKLIKDVNIFDVYVGIGVPAGYKSLAIRVNICDPEKTLVEKEVTEVMDKVVATLRIKFGGEIRG